MNKKMSQKIIVLFQGNCPFCNWCRVFAEKRDRTKQLLFVEIESETGNELIRAHRLSIDPQHPQTIVVISPDGGTTHKWQASFQIGKQLHSPWRQLAHVMSYLPHSLGDKMYDWVGAHRAMLCQLVRCKRLER